MKHLILASLVGILLLSTTANALEVDEKLTLRVVKMSDSRKTILINRGTEDGLVEGDHAKFFVSAGIVARAVCVRVSPSRSVWSIYRLVNADFVANDAVMTLKISPPVKITQDETKMIVQDDQPTQVTPADGETAGIPLAEGANDLSPEAKAAASMSQADLMALQGMQGGNLREKQYEIWGAMHISNLSAKAESSDGSDSFSGGDVYTQLTLGGEYYFKEEGMWWAKFSPLAFVNVQRKGFLAFQGSKNEGDLTEFGAGLNWHLWKQPSVVNDFIPFINFTVAMGMASSTYTPGAESVGGPAETARGKTMSYSLGAGIKFYTFKGYGFRALVDYYTRTEEFERDNYGITWKRQYSGPRLYMGVSYRF